MTLLNPLINSNGLCTVLDFQHTQSRHLLIETVSLLFRTTAIFFFLLPYGTVLNGSGDIGYPCLSLHNNGRKCSDDKSTSLVQGKVIAFDPTQSCLSCTETAIPSALWGLAKHRISILDIARAFVSQQGRKREILLPLYKRRNWVTALNQSRTRTRIYAAYWPTAQSPGPDCPETIYR